MQDVCYIRVFHMYWCSNAVLIDWGSQNTFKQIVQLSETLTPLTNIRINTGFALTGACDWELNMFIAYIICIL